MNDASRPLEICKIRRKQNSTILIFDLPFVDMHRIYYFWLKPFGILQIPERS